MSMAWRSGAGSTKYWRQQWFFASDTWDPPAANTAIEIMAWGGGGGGQAGVNIGVGGGAAGTDGGDTKVDDSTPTNLLTVVGGEGGNAGSTKGYQVAIQLEFMTTDPAVGSFSSSEQGYGFMGIGTGGRAANTQGFAAAGSTNPGKSGSSGQVGFYRGTTSLTLTITVGDGGAGGTSGFGNGQKGQPGAVLLRWLE